MLAISLGPLALPLPPLLLLGAVLTAQWLASRLARRPQAGDGALPDGAARRAAQAGDGFTTAALLGLLAARGAYVTLHADAYFAAPWSVIDVRDGGWHAGAGLAAGLGWLAWRAWRRPALRRALAAGATAGALLWFGLHAALTPARGTPMPALEVAALDGAGRLTLPQAAQGLPAVVVRGLCAPMIQRMQTAVEQPHTQPSAEVAQRLRVQVDEGLAADEVSARQQRFGANRLPEAPPRSVWQRVLAQFRDFMILVLLAAAVVSGLIGDLADTVVILVIVLLNAAIGFWQEWRADQALAALQRMASPHATVRRDGGLPAWGAGLTR